MSVHHRSSVTESDALYHPIPQAETPVVEANAVLDLQDDEDVFAEEFVAQERAASHDTRIYWIHLVLGCAVLLPWNGT